MKFLILYLVTFGLVYLFYLLFVLRRKNVLKKLPNGKEITYLKIKYGIKVNDNNLKKIANIVFLGNSFILSTTLCVVCLFESLLIEILVGIPTLILLILIVYHIIGIILRKKQGGKKHV